MLKRRVLVTSLLLVLSVAGVIGGWLLFDRAESRPDVLTCAQSGARVLKCTSVSSGNDTVHLYASSVLVAVGTALLGSAIVIVVVDWLLGSYERRIGEQRTAAERLGQLMAQIKSGSRELAVAAVDELRSTGALYNGNLNGVSLGGANLSNVSLDGASLVGVDFGDADLSGASLLHAKLMQADLTGCDLRDANMCWADLTATHVTERQLRTLAMLWSSTLPDGSRYDGHLDLPGDRDFAREMGIVGADSAAMARFYGVSSLE